ncbi:MAG: hypothetical protein HY319_09980 [Armatimonadetes bacterium]|nr:hypothetical protein [Armatimonadota bacterium]
MNDRMDSESAVVRILLIERAARQTFRDPAVVDRRQDELRRALRSAAGCWSAYSQEDSLPRAA